ncbi:hypothetical protein RHECNPAF_3500033 [Rhizobium etli CNPAF512]|nr:hypothetical protein RHECNPAF_3500033 [Rhizobium etli CNPAF512]
MRTSARATPLKATIAVRATADRRDFFILLLPIFGRVPVQGPAHYPPLTAPGKRFHSGGNSCLVSTDCQCLSFHENAEVFSYSQ